MENPPLLRRLRPYAIGFVIAVALIGVLGFLAGPPIARHLLLDALSKQLHRPVSIGEISINPYAMTARVTNVSIGERDNGVGETAGFDQLFLNVSLASLFRVAPVIEEFSLTGPRVRLVHEAPGRYNISDLLDEWMKPSEAPMPRFSVNNIKITGGRVEFDDRTVDRKHVVSEINLALPFVSNLAHQANSYTEPAFSAKVNGAPLELTGKSKPFAEVKESELKLELDRFELAPYSAYSPVALPFAIASGQLETDLAIVFRNDGKQPATLAIAGKAAIDGLNLVENGGSPLLTLAKLNVPVTGLDPINGRYRIGDIQIDGLEIHARADRSGDLNWLTLLEKLQGGRKPDPKPAAAKATPIEWAVDGLHLVKSAIHWHDETHPQPIAAHATDIEVAVGKVDGQFSQPITVDAALSLAAAPHASTERFELRNALIDLPKRKVDVSEFSARGLKLAAGRLADGKIAGLLPPRLKQGTAEQPAAKVSDGETPWTVNLGKVELADASLRFDDKAVSPATTQTVEIARLMLANLSTAPKSTADLELAARLNRKGEIKTKGTLQPQPLAAKLNLDLRNLELLPLQPYFGEKLNLTVTKGQVATRGELALSQAADGKFLGGYRGQITVSNFHSVDKPNSADFLTWKSFHVDKLDLKLQPFALAVGEVALSDFFASLYVSPEGKLNLMQIVRKDDVAEKPVESSEQPPPAPSPDKVANVPEKAGKKPPPPIRIDQVTLQGGTVNIEDEFIKPNYSAHLTEIGGRITGLSSEAGSAADLDLRGSYDGAPVSIAGKLNPLAALPSLDLKAEVRGVEMTPLSPYAGKYAGYAIDKGKLSLFLTYKIADNKLQADNRVFLDQLTFGEKVESPTATKLPVLLAVALLKNRRGEIDINLPIAGSLDDPQFSVGGIIVQVIVNLLTKAITAPFALLGSLFGGGEELSHAGFTVGRASLSDATAKKLESLAKALDDRPALKLEITGRIDPEKDREGLRQAMLEHKVKAQKLAQLVKAGNEVGSVDDVTIDDKEYLPLLEQAYKQEKFPKPRNVIGLAKSLPREEMEKLMLANAAASDEDLRELANQRAKSVADWLAGPGKIPRERIFLLPPKLAADDSDPKEAPLSRADFSLK
jgi:uncharacterized protein involved in outer membrane biogenesis